MAAPNVPASTTSLDNYLAEVRALFAEAFAEPDLFDSLEAMIDRAIDKFTRLDARSGCFMMNTAMPEAAEDPAVSEVVRTAMDLLDRAFVRRFERAIEAGQIPADADPQALATIMVANHYELSARARAGYSHEELRALGARAVALIRSLIGRGRSRPRRRWRGPLPALGNRALSARSTGALCGRAGGGYASSSNCRRRRFAVRCRRAGQRWAAPGHFRCGWRRRWESRVRPRGRWRPYRRQGRR